MRASTNNLLRYYDNNNGFHFLLLVSPEIQEQLRIYNDKFHIVKSLVIIKIPEKANRLRSTGRPGEGRGSDPPGHR